MRGMRLFIAALLMLTLLPAAPASAQSGDFTDIDDNVHASNIRKIAARGVTRGCGTSGTEYCPGDPVSRAQMASFLVRALKLPSSDVDAFRDDDGLSAEADINALAAAGVTTGCEGGRKFCPAQRVRRDQMATFLANGFKIKASKTDFFADDQRNTHRARINALAAAGITTGCNDLQSRYCPSQNVRRDQMATFLAKAMKLTTRTPVDPVLETGDKGPRVTALQQRLKQRGYWMGGADGSFGYLTQQALFAFQKAQGLSRDGVYGPQTRNRLESPKGIGRKSTSGFVVEIDKKRQILMLVRDGDIQWVFNTSTGTEKPYTHEGRKYLADTPPGKWRITRQVDGWRDGELGHLYRPKYFHHDGIAIHGYTSVPPYPASHGCARVSMEAIDWMWKRVPVGTAVWVY